MLHDYETVLHAPWTIQAGTKVRGGRITIADDFDYTVVPNDSLGLVRLSDGVELEDVEIVGRPAAWWAAKAAAGEPWPWPTRGFAAVNTKFATMHGCRATDIPAEAFYCRDSSDLLLEEVYAERCNAGVAFDWPRVSGNLRFKLYGFTGLDMLSMQSNWNAIGTSILFPSLWVGANWVWGMGLVDSDIVDVRGYGEGKGIKFTHCDYLRMKRIRSPHLSISGRMTTPPTGWVGPALVRGNVLTESVLGESTFGFSMEKSSDPVVLSFDSPVDEVVQIDTTTLIAPRAGTLSAPWLNPPISGWRYQVVQATNGARANLGPGVERIDMNDEQANPTWVQVYDTATVTQDPGMPAIRSYTAHWES